MQGLLKQEFKRQILSIPFISQTHQEDVGRPFKDLFFFLQVNLELFFFN